MVGEKVALLDREGPEKKEEETSRPALAPVLGRL